MREPHSFPQLPISFTIKLISSYEDSAVFLTGAENDNISRDALVALNLNDMAYSKFLRKYLALPGLLNQGVDLVVGLLVSAFTVVIIVGFLEERKAKHEDKRGEIGEEKADLEHADELTKCDK